MKQVLVTLWICVTLITSASAQLTRDWLRVVDRPTTTIYNPTFLVTPNGTGGLFVACQINNGGNYVVVLSKVSSLGEVLWCFTYQPSQSYTYEMTAITADASGDLYALLVAKSSDSKAHIAKISGGTGAVLWQKNLAAGLGSCIVIDGSNQPVVSTTAHPTLLSTVTIYKFNSQSGSTVWSRLASTLLTNPNSTSCLAYCPADDSLSLNVGKSTGVMVLSKLRDADGSIVFVNSVSSLVSYADPRSGSTYSVATSTNTTSITKFDPSGALQWTNSYPFQLGTSFVNASNLYCKAGASGVELIEAIDLDDGRMVMEATLSSSSNSLQNLATCLVTVNRDRIATYSFDSLSQTGEYLPVPGDTFPYGSTRPCLTDPFRLLTLVGTTSLKQLSLYTYGTESVPLSIVPVQVRYSGADYALTPSLSAGNEVITASRNNGGLELATARRSGLSPFAVLGTASQSFSAMRSPDGNISIVRFQGVDQYYERLDSLTSEVLVSRVVFGGRFLPDGDCLEVSDEMVRRCSHVDGSELWRLTLPSFGSSVRINSVGLRDNGYVYACDSNRKKLYVVDVNTGTLVRTVGDIGTNPLELYSTGSQVYLFERGSTTWKVSELNNLGEPIYTTQVEGVLPVPARGSGYVVSKLGDIYVYEVIYLYHQCYLNVKKYNTSMSTMLWTYSSDTYAAPATGIVLGVAKVDEGGDAYFVFGGADQQAVLLKLDRNSGLVLGSRNLVGRVSVSIAIGSFVYDPGDMLVVTPSGSLLTSTHLFTKDSYSSIQYERFSQTTVLSPQTLECSSGKVTEGSLQSVTEFDGNCLIVDGSDDGGCDIVLGLGQGLRSPESVRWSLSCRSLGSSVTAQVWLWDFRVQRWVPLSQRVVGNGMKSFEGFVPRGASRFVDPVTSECRMRISAAPSDTSVDVPVALAVDKASVKSSSE